MKRCTKGSVTATAVIFIFVSLLLTASYLKYSMSASVMQKYRFEETKALYLAETGINIEALPILPKIIKAVQVIGDEVQYSNMGTYSNVYCTTYVDLETGQTTYMARGNGTTHFNNTLGKPVSITRKAILKMKPESFADFMYFTNSEEPGGGPGLGSYVSFGGYDELEGKVYTNGHMQMSQYGCPDFTNARVFAVQGISYNNCNPDQWLQANDEANALVFPPYNAQQRAIENASITFTADDLLFRSSGRDTLIMTEIEFVDNGFYVSQWTYLIPPVGVEGPPPTNFRWDLDTSGNLNDRRIAFDAPWDSISGFYLTDTLFIDNEDVDGNDISNVLADYEVGDTISVFAADPDSNKSWLGRITAITTTVSGAVFSIANIAQFFNNGFVDAEEVTLGFIASPDNTIPFNRFANYHNHPDDGWSVCDTSGLHHFDFEPPSGGPDIMSPTMFYAGEQTVIYVRNGQVRVKGTVDGQYTLVTDQNTYYRRSDDFTIMDRVWNNIWIVDDIIYEDSNTMTGEVVYGTPNRLGLFSGANIILANTAENGGRNRANGEDIIVNAALMAMEGSVVAHYWQNTIASSAYSGPNLANPATSLADGRGPHRNPTSSFPTYTGNSDIRGDFIFWGSMSQKKRGYMKRNAPGPYNVSPGIGYDKDYNYDYNFSDFSIPPYYPPASRADGSTALVIKAYGEIPTNTNKGTSQ